VDQEGMATKSKREKHAEQIQFTIYNQFCDNTAVGKECATKKAKGD
jgi:hypothetical protein